MQAALDTVTGKPVSADDTYREMSESERAVLRLVCPGWSDEASAECRAPVAFRNRTRDGKRACFSASHRAGCDHGSEPSDDVPGDAGRPVPQRPASAAVIDIDLSAAAPSRGPDGRHRPDEAVAGASTRRHALQPAAGGVGQGSTRRRLSTLAAALADPGRSLDPGAWVRLEGFPELPVRFFFVRMELTSPEWHGRRRGYYGMVRRVDRGVKPGSLFVYVEGAWKPSLKVVLTSRDQKMLRLGDPQELVGRHILALGWYTATAAGTAYITPASSAGRVAVAVVPQLAPGTHDGPSPVKTEPAPRSPAPTRAGTPRPVAATRSRIGHGRAVPTPPG
ncbi:hypothetical protein ACFQ80_05875 [Isoptericola sp. NPDC056578]|uniref:hypothetical protein n=1 Tax=Isoptericola sp. NPDC056578 TaxID=3345870 RepID=UPI0036BE334C